MEYQENAGREPIYEDRTHMPFPHVAVLSVEGER
jgi:hypothetical protein